MAEQGSFLPEPTKEEVMPFDSAKYAADVAASVEARQHRARAAQLKASGIDPSLEGADLARAALEAVPVEASSEDDEGRPDATAHEGEIGRIPTPAEFGDRRDSFDHRQFDQLHQATRPAEEEPHQAS